jgi:hypothetical protein
VGLKVFHSAAASAVIAARFLLPDKHFSAGESVSDMQMAIQLHIENRHRKTDVFNKKNPPTDADKKV